MADFRDRLRKTRDRASSEAERKKQAEAEAKKQRRDTRTLVDQTADAIEAHIESRLVEFQSEYLEFRRDSRTHDGRHLRVFWDEPLAGKKKTYHELSFHVRRYHDYADVEVVAKCIVRNRDRRRRSLEEDVHEGDPKRFEPFVESEILAFAQIYSGAD